MWPCSSCWRWYVIHLCSVMVSADLWCHRQTDWIMDCSVFVPDLRTACMRSWLQVFCVCSVKSVWTLFNSSETGSPDTWYRCTGVGTDMMGHPHCTPLQYSGEVKGLITLDQPPLFGPLYVFTFLAQGWHSLAWGQDVLKKTYCQAGPDECQDGDRSKTEKKGRNHRERSSGEALFAHSNNSSTSTSDRMWNTVSSPWVMKHQTCTIKGMGNIDTNCFDHYLPSALPE